MSQALDRDQIDIIKGRLFRKFLNDLPGLQNFEDEIAQSSFDEVVVTSTGWEGGRDSGQVKFNKFCVLAAIRELIDEQDPANAYTPRPRVVQPDFRLCGPV
jgi:hypothetical protein